LKRTLIIFLPLLLSFNLSASDSDKTQTVKRIDAEFDKCLSTKPKHTNSLSECATLSTVSWDKELNSRYKKLIKTLNSSEEAALRQSQRQWIRFRDAELQYLQEVFQNSPSTSNELYFAEAHLNLVKQRALSL